MRQIERSSNPLRDVLKNLYVKKRLVPCEAGYRIEERYVWMGMGPQPINEGFLIGDRYYWRYRDKCQELLPDGSTRFLDCREYEELALKGTPGPRPITIDQANRASKGKNADAKRVKATRKEPNGILDSRPSISTIVTPERADEIASHKFGRVEIGSEMFDFKFEPGYNLKYKASANPNKHKNSVDLVSELLVNVGIDPIAVSERLFNENLVNAGGYDEGHIRYERLKKKDYQKYEGGDGSIEYGKDEGNETIDAVTINFVNSKSGEHEEIKRTFVKSQDGELIADHMRFFLPEGRQGGGNSKKM